MFAKLQVSNTVHIHKVWLVLLIHSILTCEHVAAQLAYQSKPQEVSIRVDNQSPTTDWRLILASNGDTLVNGPLTDGLLSVELDRRRSYHVNFYINDGTISKDYYINGYLHNIPVIRFTCNSV